MPTKKGEHARLSIGSDTESDEALIKRAKVVGDMAPKTAEYANDQAFKNLIDALVADGLKLDAAVKKVTALEAELAEARKDRDQQRFATEDSHGAAAKQV